jgi:hypothetical protein
MIENSKNKTKKKNKEILYFIEFQDISATTKKIKDVNKTNTNDMVSIDIIIIKFSFSDNIKESLTKLRLKKSL